MDGVNGPITGSSAQGVFATSQGGNVTVNLTGTGDITGHSGVGILCRISGTSGNVTVDALTIFSGRWRTCGHHQYGSRARCL